MTDPIVSATTFKWFLILVTGVVSALWLVYDVINLVRARNLDRSVGVNRDKQFGYAMGIVIASVGVIGVLRFQGVI
jgi:hypothetical protein